MAGGPLITENAPGNFTLVGILQAEPNTAEIKTFKNPYLNYAPYHIINSIEIRTQIYMKILGWDWWAFIYGWVESRYAKRKYGIVLRYRNSCESRLLPGLEVEVFHQYQYQCIVFMKISNLECLTPHPGWGHWLLSVWKEGLPTWEKWNLDASPVIPALGWDPDIWRDISWWESLSLTLRWNSTDIILIKTF